MKFASAYGIQALNDDSCFLCGATFDITEEHVFPKWLQKKYSLQKECLTLLNQTQIQYKNLKIPCCRKCNNESLSQLENKIQEAVANGYDACLRLDKTLWYLWAGKIYYGILRKEYSLPRDRRDPTKGSIATEKGLELFKNLHLFLQGIRGKHKFSDTAPFSILICNLYEIKNGSNYYFIDDLIHFTLAFRMSEVGVVVVFEDAELINRTFGSYIKDVNGRKLHPIQFDELYAKVTYQVSLMEYTPYYITSGHIEGDWPANTHVTWGGNVREWKQEEFAAVLECHISKWLPNSEQK